jgi:hypothetical protein
MAEASRVSQRVRYCEPLLPRPHDKRQRARLWAQITKDLKETGFTQPSQNGRSIVTNSLSRTLAALLFAIFAAKAGATCDNQAFVNEKKDAPTVLRLESAWNSAFLGGDTESMTCLLTPDFTEIMRNGSIYHRSDELALTQKNRAMAKAVPALPQITVLLHNDVAVAYGLASELRIKGVLYKNYYADYYVWTNGSWHAFFAQWTPALVPST